MKAKVYPDCGKVVRVKCGHCHSGATPILNRRRVLP
jgi:hypothetical protein